MLGVLIALSFVRSSSGKLTLQTQQLVASAVARQMRIGKHKVGIGPDFFLLWDLLTVSEFI